MMSFHALEPESRARPKTKWPANAPFEDQPAKPKQPPWPPKPPVPEGMSKMGESRGIVYLRQSEGLIPVFCLNRREK